MTATARIPRAWLGAALCLLLAAGLPAWGQTENVVEDVDTGADLRFEVDEINTNFDSGEISLVSSGANGGDFDVLTGLTVSRDITIRGDSVEAAMNITIDASNADSIGATILVERGGTLRLENLTITSSGDVPAIRVMAGGALILERVLVQDAAAEGVITVDEAGVTDPARVTVVSSIFDNNADDAILNEARNAQINVLQSTFLDNGDGVRHDQSSDPESDGSSTIIVAASIFEGNSGTALGSSNPALSIESWANYFDGSIAANVSTVRPTITDPPDFQSSPAFPGDVVSALRSDVSFNDLPESLTEQVATIWFRDFKKLTRDPANLQLGADEEGGLLTPVWFDVVVRYQGVEGDFFGPRKPAEIEVVVSNIDIDQGAILIVPERGDVADPDTYITLNNPVADSDGVVYQATLTASATFPFSDPTIPIDGRATIYLVDNNGVVIGDDDADPLSVLLEGNLSRRQFVIDTIPPALFESSVREQELVVFSPDDTSLAPLPTGSFAFPLAWEPGFEEIPRSAALWQTGTPRAFTNAGSPMDLTVGVDFVEVFPELPDTTIIGIETSGFRDFGLLLDDISAPDQRNILFPPSIAPEFYGTAYLQSTGEDIAGGEATIAHVSGADDAGRPFLDARWTFGNQGFTGGWQRNFQFAATDRAGNIATASNEAEVYWLRNPAALLDGPGDVETSNPEFNWSVGGGSSFAPADSPPSQPIARFSLWRARDVTQQVWDNIMPWSQWQVVTVINRDTVLFPNFGRLGAFLDLPEAQGEVLAMLPQVADQAGNLSPTILDESATPSRADLLGFGATIWGTPGFAATVDTNVQAFFWHNRVDGGDQRAREPGEPFFGAATRIPLPAIEECFYRVEAAFTIGYELSDRQPPAFADKFSNFQLFEDGRLVASGGILVPTDTYTTSLVIPQDLFNAPTGTVFNEAPAIRQAFLNAPPDPCINPNRPQDRLGDEGNFNEDFPERGNRYRDVTYTLEVQNGYQFVPLGGGDPVTRLDPTPASYTWVVSVDTPLGDEQPIKSFGRE